MTKEERDLKIVNKDSYHILTIKNPSEKVQLAALKDNPYLIGKIENPCLEAQWLVVKKGVRFMWDLDDPAEEIQLLGVLKCKTGINYIRNPTSKVRKAAKDRWGIGDKLDKLLDKARRNVSGWIEFCGMYVNVNKEKVYFGGLLKPDQISMKFQKDDADHRVSVVVAFMDALLKFHDAAAAPENDKQEKKMTKRIHDRMRFNEVSKALENSK